MRFVKGWEKSQGCWGHVGRFTGSREEYPYPPGEQPASLDDGCIHKRTIQYIAMLTLGKMKHERTIAEMCFHFDHDKNTT